MYDILVSAREDVHISSIPTSFIFFYYINIMEYILVTKPNGNMIMDTSGNILVQKKPGKYFYFYVIQTCTSVTNYRLYKNIFAYFLQTIFKMNINIKHFNNVLLLQKIH